MSTGKTQTELMSTLMTSVIGSHMHQCNTSQSDFDLRIVGVTPLRYLISPFTANKIKPKVEENDIIFYELRHFLALIAGGSPSVFEVLYSPMAAHCLPMGEELIVHRRRFIEAGRAKKNMLGYMAGMMQDAAKGTRPLKALRSGILAGEVFMAYAKDTHYDPLTSYHRSAILNSNGGITTEELLVRLKETMGRVAGVEPYNEFNEAYIRDYNLRLYLSIDNA